MAVAHAPGHRERTSIHDAIAWCEDCDWTEHLPDEADIDRAMEEAMTRRQTLDEFIATHGITSTATEVTSNPNMPDAGDSSHWRVTLRRGGYHRMIVPFSMGSALQGPPLLSDVLDCLASDSAGYENNRRFEEWAAEYGYDPDSRKAEHTFEAIRKQAEALARFLGTEAYDELLWRTDHP